MFSKLCHAVFPVCRNLAFGSCNPKTKAGVWSAILQRPDTDEQEVSGAEACTTFARMELTAAIRAIEMLTKPCRAVIHSNEYLVLGIKKWLPWWQITSWRNAAGECIKNVDLWMPLQQATAQLDLECCLFRPDVDAGMKRRLKRLAKAASQGGTA
ncbi:RNase H family protein [Siccirubricoccus deserti]